MYSPTEKGMLSIQTSLFVTLFKIKSTFSIDEIEWLLLKYSNAQEYLLRECGCYKEHYKVNCDCDRDEEEQIFLKIFNRLDSLSIYHKCEQEAKEQVKNYSKIKGSKKKSRKWFLENESLAFEKLSQFIANFIDYKDGKQCKNLLAYRNSKEEIEIFVKGKNFEYIVDFLEIVHSDFIKVGEYQYSRFYKPRLESENSSKRYYFEDKDFDMFEY